MILWYYYIMILWHYDSMTLWYSWIMVLWYHDIILWCWDVNDIRMLWCHDYLSVTWFIGVMVQLIWKFHDIRKMIKWYYDSMIQYDSMILWYYDIMTLWHLTLSYLIYIYLYMYIYIYVCIPYIDHVHCLCSLTIAVTPAWRIVRILGRVRHQRPALRWQHRSGSRNHLLAQGNAASLVATTSIIVM